jgi:hypothetical protein
MVGQLGFTEHDAKWALKITDTGDMIDTDAAVRFLLKEETKRSGSERTCVDRGSENLVDPLVSAPKHSGDAGWRWA